MTIKSKIVLPVQIITIVWIFSILCLLFPTKVYAASIEEETLQETAGNILLWRMNNKKEQTAPEIKGKYATISTSKEEIHSTPETDEGDKEVEPIFDLTLEEQAFLTQCVWAEAGNSTAECKRATAEAILNRVEKEWFPDDVRSVITQRGQFAVVSNRTIYRVVEDEETIQAVQEAMYDRMYSPDIVYFRLGGYFKSKKYNIEPYDKFGTVYFSTQVL